jgi:hypothetical protein
MTRTDAVSILRILKANYQNFYRNITKEEAEDIIELWSTMFNEPLPVVLNAVKAVIVTKKDYPPTIADVKEKIQLMTQTEFMTEQEAWNIIYRGICNANYRAKEQFEQMPDILQRLVGSPNQLREWAMMDSNTVKSVISSNLMRSYKARAKYNNDIQSLPDRTGLIEGLGQKFSIEN